jgi:hypothetical protein
MAGAGTNYLVALYSFPSHLRKACVVQLFYQFVFHFAVDVTFPHFSHFHYSPNAISTLLCGCRVCS